MSKMLFEVQLPLVIAQVKEDLGVNNIWKYLRYIRMFLERCSMKHRGVDISYSAYNILLWDGVVAFVKDKIYGIVACKVIDGKKNANGNYAYVDVQTEDGSYKKKNLKVNEDCVLMYHDTTRIPPVIYIWAIANEIITREDIIRTQDNMLRKPILVDGIGEDFDNSMVQASNVLSGVSFINRKTKKKTVMQDEGMEVLNLQVGNSYKGAELWNSRKNFEELLCDYLGYTTVKNEKRERMNTTEVVNENSVGMTFYESFLFNQDMAKKQIKEYLDEEIEITNHLKTSKEDNENVSNEKEMD